jgi:hypothetical protein
VLVDGQPAKGALVAFHPVGGAANAIRPVGHVDEQGLFRLTSYKQGDGAPAGEYQVTVTWFLATPSGASGDDDSVAVNRLPGRYASAGTSQLRGTVARGTNELPAFELQSR